MKKGESDRCSATEVVAELHKRKSKQTEDKYQHTVRLERSSIVDVKRKFDAVVAEIGGLDAIEVPH